MRSIPLFALVILLLAGCATTDTRVEPQEQKEFVTGSNIPRRDRSGSGVTVAGREALERVQNSGPITRGSETPR